MLFVFNDGFSYAKITLFMDKVYNHKEVEEKWYRFWEEGNYFAPKIDPDKKPFTIILPPPNANADLHLGHAMYTVEDVLIRYHRMKGDPTLWLPGADHAGYETQFVFEKKLNREGMSRFDFDRDSLYRAIWDFVSVNRSHMEDQLKRLGFSLDWSRRRFTLDPEIINNVYKTFFSLFKDGLVYRGERIVNYCTKCGTAFSDLEINYVERVDPLYYIKYGPFILATTRPETKFGDTAVCFHPGDKRYTKYLGQEIEVQGVNGPFKVKVIEDEAIDPNFGTGIEKVTPGHDVLDFEIGQKHNLQVKKVIDLNGRLNELAGRFSGMKVNDARAAVASAMKEAGLIDHIDESYSHSVATCYKCGTTIEPMVMPQWFVKTKPLAEKAISAVKDKKIKIIPSYFDKTYFNWLNNIKDWNISRQIAWGIRIPVWYCATCNNLNITFLPSSGKYTTGDYRELRKNYSYDEIYKGLQILRADKEASFIMSFDKPSKCEKCNGGELLQETDVFDTWFSSGQWPIVTLAKNPTDFKYFYPTTVMETAYEILFFWVARMVMLGIYLTNEVPFEVVYLHGLIRDEKHQKMSKSKGNVINPIDMVEKYGADALRISLIFGSSPATDMSIREDRIRGFRNFSNKIWNAARFVLEERNDNKSGLLNFDFQKLSNPDDKKIVKELNQTINEVTSCLEDFRLGQAAESIYEFFWHSFCDKYIESTKNRRDEAQPVLLYILTRSMQLLHPFMPFVTEEIWDMLPKNDNSPILISQWPKPDL